MFGFKNLLKSISLGNLAAIDDNATEFDDSPLSAHSHSRSDKHNLSSINDQKRELQMKLKEFSDVTHRSWDNGLDLEFSPQLPENNLSILQGRVTRETYQQQSAMWELLVTEKNFLKQIQFVVEVYISAFERLMQNFFPRINVSHIFSNLKEVYKVSLIFWKECMYPLLKELSLSQNSLQSHLLKNGFTKIGEILEPYILYCTEISTCRSYILALEKENDLFSEFTKWAMEFEESNREMLCDHLAKPFQRLTKYKILLQAIQKYSSSNEKSDIQEMIESVDLFVTKVNEKVEEKTLIRKLLHLSHQIDSYDVIEPMGDDLLSIINKYNKFDVTTPILIGGRKKIRQMTCQAEMKLREGPSKTIDTRLYLFTDILLITKFKKKAFGKLKIIKPPVMLDKAHFPKLTNNSFACVCLNEFNCISSLYHFSCGDSKKMDEWLQKLEETVKSYAHLNSTQNDISAAAESQNPIPKVNVLEPSPKRNASKSYSNNENENNECSFKRKSPVQRKQHSKRDNALFGVEMSLESTSRGQMDGHSSLMSVEHCQVRKLSKSNSFQDKKKPISKQPSDSSDIDDAISMYHTNTSISVVNPIDQRNETDRDMVCDFPFVSNKTSRLSKYRTEPSPRISETLDKNLSKSLNKLNYSE